MKGIILGSRASISPEVGQQAQGGKRHPKLGGGGTNRRNQTLQACPCGFQPQQQQHVPVNVISPGAHAKEAEYWEGRKESFLEDMSLEPYWKGQGSEA